MRRGPNQNDVRVIQKSSHRSSLVLLRFKEKMRSVSANRPGASMSNGCWLPIVAACMPGEAQSVHSRGTANEPGPVRRRLKVSTPETRLTFRTANR
jgi:hypothetical protein